MSAYHQSKLDDPNDKWLSDDNPCKSSSVNFFPDNGGADLQAAIRICLSCSNRRLCLDYALRNHIEHGVWGGQSERGRSRIATSRRRMAS
jgi:WhiB family transcriptional regulator, redox-sensing transcriptional regulator